MSEYTFSADAAGDPAELLELTDAVGRTSLDERVFEWWFEHNPAGEGLISVARSNGNVVGMAAMSPFPILLDGTRAVVPVPVHVATDPEHRRRGIFSELELLNERTVAEQGAPLTLTFPNRASHRVFVGRLGWQDLRPLRVWARPLNARAVVRYAARRADEQGGLKPRSSAAWTFGDLVVEPRSRFGTEVDDLAARAARGYRNHIVRDARFLSWRYLESPRDYRAFGAFRGGTLEGLAVLGHAVKQGVSAGFVAELLTAPENHTARVALLRRCLGELAPRTSALIALPPRGQARAFLQLGFVPTHKRIRFVAKPLRAGVQVDSDPAAWHFTLGDFDFF